MLARGVGAAMCPRCGKYATVLSDRRFTPHGPRLLPCLQVRVPEGTPVIPWTDEMRSKHGQG